MYPKLYKLDNKREKSKNNNNNIYNRAKYFFHAYTVY